MNNREIKKAVSAARKAIADASRMMERGMFELQQIQKQCPHSDKESWTNNDGDGRFRVEKCKICGLQRDGGLST